MTLVRSLTANGTESYVVACGLIVSYWWDSASLTVIPENTSTTRERMCLTVSYSLACASCLQYGRRWRGPTNTPIQLSCGLCRAGFQPFRTGCNSILLRESTDFRYEAAVEKSAIRIMASLPSSACRNVRQGSVPFAGRQLARSAVSSTPGAMLVEPAIAPGRPSCPKNEQGVE
jgi:hypothetical protein